MKRTAKKGHIVEIPEIWEHVSKKGEKTKYFLGNEAPNEGVKSKIKIFNITDREEIELRKKNGGVSFVMGPEGEMQQQYRQDEQASQEGRFLLRTMGNDSNDCYWEGMYGDDGNPMGCTEGNLRMMALEAGLYLFVEHVGNLLDKEATRLATEEEKNSLKLLVFIAGNESVYTKADASPAKKANTKG